MGLVGAGIAGLAGTMSGSIMGLIIGGFAKLAGGDFKLWFFVPFYTIIICAVGVGYLLGVKYHDDPDGPFDEDIYEREEFVKDITG